ncbi:hypothetical protein Maes01_01406 [Microbulbifer aestuariivivens]|uniref:DUF411 domain-containing protein n=1 Tax=Microbulbifer aestuariivivens TaxID=1908308 RepID=A0ABP9WNS6_9GAMM
MFCKTMVATLAAFALITLSACGGDNAGQGDHSAATEAEAQPAMPLTTYKSATCGCCQLWIEHTEDSGFSVSARDVEDLNAVKDQYGIEPRYQSCHTSVSPQGFIFEGHVPAKIIRQFLQNPPEGARGLAVPAMPLGSPGMEVGERFTPYDVFLLHSDGSVSVYAHIDSIEAQH